MEKRDAHSVPFFLVFPYWCFYLQKLSVKSCQIYLSQEVSNVIGTILFLHGNYSSDIFAHSYEDFGITCKRYTFAKDGYNQLLLNSPRPGMEQG